ncbi:MAG: tetratricopeptide repeat protein [Bacteroidota bacterium]
MKWWLTIIILCLTPAVIAQSVKWPEDTAQAQRNWALFTDNVRAQNHSEALVPFQWLVEQAPDLTPTLYIQGEKLFKGLVAETDNPVQRVEYQQRQLDLYDQRIRYFSDAAKVMNRKAHAAYQYYRDQPEKYADLLEIFEQAFQVCQDQFSSVNLVAYLDVVRRYRQANDTEPSDEEVLRLYDQFSQLLQQKNGPDAKEKQELLDKLLISTITLDCTTIQEKFGGPFFQDTTRVDQAKKVIALALAYQCSDAPFFMTALRVVFQYDPSVGTAKTIAKLYEARDNPQNAEKYWQQAIDLAEENEEKADLWYSLAQHYQRNNRKLQAREAAQKSIQLGASRKTAYKLIGDLYFSSFDDCKGGKSIVQDRAVYWAAYEMYQRAGRSDLMQQVEQQFPTMEQIFQEDLKKGETMQVGCWINEEVIVRRRPSQ